MLVGHRRAAARRHRCYRFAGASSASDDARIRREARVCGAWARPSATSLPLGVGVALSPLPIVGVILMLPTPRARPNAVAFLAGWIVALAGVGAIVLLISSGIGASNDG